jgi:hypothetical protein
MYGNHTQLSPVVGVDENFVDLNLSPIEKAEDSAQKRQREIEESEELARRLMEEEAIESYRQSVSFLQAHASDYSAEDFAMIQAAMGQSSDINRSTDYDEEENVDEREDGALSPSSELSYDALLRLGERIGDVKMERWALRARLEIDKLPVIRFSTSEIVDENETRINCLVCQIPYEPDDTLRKLPCAHYFHLECVDHWLMAKDVCPYCRQSIIS